jgi:hypothetical protein
MTRTCLNCKETFECKPYVVRRGHGRYCSHACSDKGRSRPMVKRFWDAVDKSGTIPGHVPELGPCWIWTRGKVNGYGILAKPGHNSGYVVAPHFSWGLHAGKVPKGKCVLHKCDNRACVRPSHLFVGTRTDNFEDMVRKGRSVWQKRWKGICKPK